MIARRLTMQFAAILLWAAGVFHAQADDAAPVTDPAQVAEHYRQVVARPQFQEASEPDPNERMKDILSQWFTQLGTKFGEFKYTQEMPRFASLLMSVLAVLSIIGLLYTMVRLTRRRSEWHPAEPAADPVRKSLRAPEFYEEELRRAVAGGDWHAAWLATWRQFLSRLEKEHLVDADRSRTNREYLAQLRERPQTGSAVLLLARLVDAYDLFIYGRRPVGEADWQSFQQQIDEAGLLLHLQERPSFISRPA